MFGKDKKVQELQQTILKLQSENAQLMIDNSQLMIEIMKTRGGGYIGQDGYYYCGIQPDTSSSSA